jgi:hypothetical protein
MERRKEGKSSTSQLQRGGSTKVKSFIGAVVARAVGKQLIISI